MASSNVSFADNLVSQFQKFAQACPPSFLAFLRPVYLSLSLENHTLAFWEEEGRMEDDLAWAVFML